jgi:hypothetical protein
LTHEAALLLLLQAYRAALAQRYYAAVKYFH